MASYTGQAIVNLVLTQLGMLEQGGTPSASDSNSVLSLANAMIQQWHLRDEFVPSILATSWPLVANIGSYTIGPAGTFNGARPTFIERAYITIPAPAGGSNVITFPLNILSSKGFADIADLSAVADIPEKLYDDRASPLSTLTLYPTPRCTVATKLQLWTWQQLGTFTTLATSVDLPDGYLEPILNAVAFRCLAQFGTAVNQAVAENVRMQGSNAEQVIAQLNTRARGLTPPQPEPAGDDVTLE